MKGLAPQQIKERIPHTWPLFFARHGRFTPVQQQAIPPILDGNQVLVVAPTASGKTEAVLSPLLERHWSLLGQPGLGLLYICPTRALVRDLYERLRPFWKTRASRWE
jgi:ATP-dependent helicase Lhr and Lhr-like helicase